MINQQIAIRGCTEEKGLDKYNQILIKKDTDGSIIITPLSDNTHDMIYLYPSQIKEFKEALDMLIGDNKWVGTVLKCNVMLRGTKLVGTFWWNQAHQLSREVLIIVNTARGGEVKLNYKYIDIQKQDETHYNIYDKTGEYLATLNHIRVGAWMSWVLTDILDKSIYFSASCLDDITKPMKELNAQKRT